MNERHSNLLKVISKTNKDKQSCMQNFAKGEAKLGYLKKRGHSFSLVTLSGGGANVPQP